MSGDSVEEAPTCVHCFGAVKFHKSRLIWFHTTTKRVDCLKSDFDDSPYSTALPQRDYVERARNYVASLQVSDG